MAPRYEPAHVHGGPLDGQLVQAPLRKNSHQPERVLSLPVPVLDEQTEIFSWDTANSSADVQLETLVALLTDFLRNSSMQADTLAS
jgi:hypothetical protein